jgi:hypothetical protein
MPGQEDYQESHQEGDQTPIGNETGSTLILGDLCADKTIATEWVLYVYIVFLKQPT